MMRTLFLQAPSFEGFDGGAGARYQMRREIKSFWYPTWLAQPAALVEGSKLIDAPPHRLSFADIAPEAARRDLVVLHTSTPSFASDVKTVRALKELNPNLKIGMVGAKVAVDPTGSLQACEELDFVARNEFDFTVKEVAEGRDFAGIKGLSYRNADGRIVHNEERAILHNMDELPFVTPVYKRDLTIENYFGGYLLHPYMSFYTGRGCKSRCTFCLWPQTVGGHAYRTRSVGHVIDELKWAKKAFPAGQGILLRRRHADRRPAARRGTGARDRQARHHLVLQRQGQRAAQDARRCMATTAAGSSSSATRPATSRSCTTSRRACWSTWPGASPRIATSSASPSTAPSSSACRARPRRPSRKPSASPPRSTRTPSRCRSPRPIPAPSSTSRPRRTAGSPPTIPSWSMSSAARSRSSAIRISATPRFSTRWRTSTSGSISARRRSPPSSARCCARRR